MGPTMAGRTTKAALAAAVLVSLGAAACAMAPTPNRRARDAGVVRMDGYNVAPPPGGGWRVDADRETGIVVFSKKWAGDWRWLFDDQRIMEVEVVPVSIPRDKWALTGEDLDAWVRGECERLLYPVGARPEWRTSVRDPIALRYLREERFLDVDPESVGLECFDDEPYVKESLCLSYLLPPDVSRARRYFEVRILTTFIDSILRPNKARDLNVLAAVVAGLEVPAPYEDVPGPLGALFRAAAGGDPEGALMAVDEGADVDGPTDDGGTALLIAIDFGHVEVARRLLERGADADVRNDEGWSPLLVAVLRSEASLAEELVERGADVDANVYATGETALLLALQRDDPGIAQKLIEAGADVNRHKDGAGTPLMAAAAKGWIDTVLHLVERGADVNARSDDGQTALKLAEAGGWTAVAELLIKAGAKR
jgi:hypothetical protein